MNKMTTAIVLAATAGVAVTGITYASAASEPVAKAAPVVQKAAPAAALPQAPSDGGGAKGNEGKGNEGREERREHRGHREHHERGVIHVNERSYSADDFGCITVVSGLGAKSLNIRNDSWREVEVFSGAVCDNGAPIATVGPHSSSDGVHPKRVHEGVEVDDGVVGSFRVAHRFHGGEGFGEGRGEGHGEGHGDRDFRN
ncbi:hypothetical protein ACH4E7_21300 [Kitasatospora sp. NPDC018058]|uniref:hypothetical protein n=1 Tax=Kitasatospora sp. NPDC018058 TaxID=3364025 RepID=UPI0037BF0810